jgi:hypothetical protein
MLLLFEEPEIFAGLGPEEMQKIIQKYNAWGEKLRRNGQLVTGHKLTDDAGRAVRRQGEELRVTDGPYSETKEVLGGYYLIEANSYDQAVERARDCPHLELGGAMVIRQIDPV